MYRVIRNLEENKIIVQRLLTPDVAGNAHWAVVATLRPDDVLLTSSGHLIKVTQATDSQIIEAILSAQA